MRKQFLYLFLGTWLFYISLLTAREFTHLMATPCSLLQIRSFSTAT